MSDKPQFRISPELSEKIQAESYDFHNHSSENTEFVHYHLSDKPTRESLEILLQAQKEMIDQAWELFKNTESVSDCLDIVGTALYSLNLTYDVNMQTLRLWHKRLHGAPSSDQAIEKMVGDINKTMEEFLGRPVDIVGMSTEEMDELVREASSKGLDEGLRDLSDRLDKTAEDK